MESSLEAYSQEIIVQGYPKSLGISPSTAHRIYCEFIERGDVGPVKSKGPKRKLDDYVELLIIGLVLETSSLYLKEMCSKIRNSSGVDVSEATVCKLLHRHGFTRKKIRQVAIQRSMSLRGEFMAEVLLYRKELLVWLDETGCNNRSFMRKYGYAIRGQVPSCKRLLVRGQRISGIAAIAMDGLVALELTTNKVNSELFF